MFVTAQDQDPVGTGRLVLASQTRASPMLSKQQIFVVMTVATDRRSGYYRFVKSCHRYGIPYRVLGLGQTWEGGDMTGLGGGHKINLLRQGLETLKAELSMSCSADGSCSDDDLDTNDIVVLFTDSYDVVMADTPGEMLRKYRQSGQDILFSAEPYCWPYRSLEDSYPTKDIDSPYKFLNSGGFVGTVAALDHLFKKQGEALNTDDDQGYFTMAYLAAHSSKNWDISLGLDTEAVLFQTLHGVKLKDLQIAPDASNLHNLVTGSQPSVIHGNGPEYVKRVVNLLGNWLAWSHMHVHEYYPGRSAPGIPSSSARSCDLTVLTAIVVDTQPSDEHWRVFFAGLASQDVPSSCLEIQVHDNAHASRAELQERLAPLLEELAISVAFLHRDIPSWALRNRIIDTAASTAADFLVMLDTNVVLTNTGTLRHLLKDNAPGVSTAVLQSTSAANSNFWSFIEDSGQYRGSPYQSPIYKRQTSIPGSKHTVPLQGVFNVPHIRSLLVVPADFLGWVAGAFQPHESVTYFEDTDDFYHLSFNMRQKAVFLFANNMEDWGYLHY